MRVVAHSRRKKPTINFEAQTFTLSRAKTYLGRLVEKAGKGEPVYIVRGQRRFLLQEVQPIEPIPMRPQGYFANMDSMSEIQEQNALAKKSVIRAPKDLE
jgi:hypothetical protein